MRRRAACPDQIGRPVLDLAGHRVAAAGGAQAVDAVGKVGRRQMAVAMILELEQMQAGLDRSAEAGTAYRTALSLTTDAAERAFLDRRLSAL